MRLWLLTTALLGLTFVGGQVYEFTTFYHEGLSLSTNLFGTTFYVLTGFHGVHVTVGHLDAAVAGGHVRAPTGCPTTRRSRSRWSGLYWHFVDIVWIVIFTVVYLIPTGPDVVGAAWPRRSHAPGRAGAEDSPTPGKPARPTRASERRRSTSGSV